MKKTKTLVSSIFILALCGLFFIPSHAFASGCTATTTGTWNTGSNWTGCNGGGGVPAITDAVTINSGVTITLNTAPTVASITLNGVLDTSSASSFAFTAGTMDLETGGNFKANSSTVTLTGTSGTIITSNGGTFTGGSSTLVISGNGDLTVAAGTGTVSVATLSLAPTLTASHTYTLGTGLSGVGANLTTNPTASSAAVLTVMMSRSLSPFGSTIGASGSATAVFDTSTSNYSLTFGGGFNVSAGGTVNANGSTITFTRTSGTGLQSFVGTFNPGTSTVVINGDGTVTAAGGGLHLYNLTLSPTITANRTYTINGTAFTINNNLTINPTAASAFTLTVNMGAAVTVTGTTLIKGTTSGSSILDTVSGSNFALSTGAMDIEAHGTLKAENSLVTVGGNWTNNGTFTPGNSTVLMNSTATATVLGPSTFYNLSITSTGAKEVDFSSNVLDIIAVTNIFSVRGSSGNLIKLHSNSAGNKWHFDPTGVATADWVDVQDGGLQGGAVNISAADYTNSGNNDSGWTSVDSVPFGSIYYVDSVSGSDSNSGISPSLAWQTLTKVNAATLNPGDEVLFDKGETFYGSLTIASSGTSANPIVFGAYGTGANPVITGFTTVSSWTSLGGNLWQSSAAVSTLSTATTVLVNGTNTAMGRFPNTGYLPYQSFSTNTSITSSSLDSTVTNWTGAEAVIKKERWIIDRGTITSASGGTINYSGGGYDGQDNYGFFIQNDPRTLDTQNEWYYNPTSKVLEIYSTTTPTNVQVSSVANLVSTTYHNYVTFNNISFTGANTAAFDVLSSANIVIQNSAISDSYDGVIGQNDGLSSAGFTLTNSTVSDINNDGVFLTSEFADPVITNDVITNIGLIAGAGGSGDGQQVDLDLEGDGGLVQYNELDNSGFIPISFDADSTTVSNNLVNNFCLIKDDGGGIYVYGDHTGNLISHNTVLNGIGTQDGLPTVFTPPSEADGIYVDGNESSGVNITDNSVGTVGYAGVYLHNSNTVTLENNTVYDAGAMGLLLKNDFDSSVISNLTVTGNIFFEKSSSAYAVQAITLHDDVATFGTFDNNYYTRPIDESDTFDVETAGDASPHTDYDLAGWQSYTGLDADSHTAPVSITDPSQLTFEYNSTASPETTSLGANYIDVAGTVYPGTITLAPYSSAVLIETAAPVISAISSGTPGETTATITWTTDETANSQVLYSTDTSYGSSSTLDASLVTSHSVTLTDLSPDTTYHYEVQSVDGAENTTTSSGDTFLTAALTASAYTFTGPTDGNINTTSTDFTITPNALYTGTVTITPSGGGLSTPIVLTFTDSSTPQTFAITPTAIGTVTLTPTNDDSLTDPSDLEYEVAAVVPGAPTAATATAGDAEATVSFSAPDSDGGTVVTGYTVTSIPSGGTDTDAGSTGLSHTITGLTNGTPYTFTVTATNSVGTGSASTASNSVTPSPALATTYTLSGPTTGAVNSASSDFTVTPNHMYTGTITITPSGGGLSAPIVLTFSGSATPQTFTITPTDISMVTLVATNDGSLTDPSDLEYTATAIAPDAPTEVTALAGNTQVVVSFSAPDSDGQSAITGYTVVSIPSGGIDADADTTALTHTITGLANGTPYTFTVTAVNIIGTSPASDPSNSVTPAVPPATTYTFTGPTDGNIHTASTNFTITPNALYTGTITVTPSGGGLSTPVVLTFDDSATPQTFALTPTAIGVMTLTASNDSELTDPSAVEYTVHAVAPDAPTDVTAVAGDGQAIVSFTPPVSDGGDAITLYSVTSTPDGTVAGGTTSPVGITGLTNGVSYTFTVTATNGIGTSVASDSSNSVIPTVAPATAYTFTGPTAGTVKTASTNFTVSPNAPYNGTITITPSGGGLSVPIVLTFDHSNVPQTFSITPTNTSTVTLVPTNDGSITDPSSLSYTATAAPVINSGGGGGFASGGGAPAVSVSTVPVAPVTQIVTCPQGDSFNATTGAACTVFTPVPVVSPVVPASPASPTISQGSFTLTLSAGSNNSQVRLLQIYLNAHGFTVAKTGPGSSGHETTFFGPATKTAVMKYQKAQHISAIGTVGPLTRASLNK